MLKNTINSYGLVSRLFHWILSLGYISLICAGYYMTSLPNSPEKYQIYALHKATGFVLLCLVTLRFIWRQTNIVPNGVEGVPYWQEVGAKLNFQVLYLLMFLMPLSGISMSLLGGYPISVYGLFTIPAFETNLRLAELANQLHKAFVIVLIISVSLHFLGAIYHHFIRRDNTLMRMIRG